MSKTVGYTTGAAAELILFGPCGGNRGVSSSGSGSSAGRIGGTVAALEKAGVVIPTHESVYGPLLDRLKDFGITWNENIEVDFGSSKS